MEERTYMVDRLRRTQGNQVTNADIVNGSLVLKRYDGSKLDLGNGAYRGVILSWPQGDGQSGGPASSVRLATKADAIAHGVVDRLVLPIGLDEFGLNRRVSVMPYPGGLYGEPDYVTLSIMCFMDEDGEFISSQTNRTVINASEAQRTLHESGYYIFDPETIVDSAEDRLLTGDLGVAILKAGLYVVELSMTFSK